MILNKAEPIDFFTNFAITDCFLLCASSTLYASEGTDFLAGTVPYKPELYMEDGHLGMANIKWEGLNEKLGAEIILKANEAVHNGDWHKPSMIPSEDRRFTICAPYYLLVSPSWPKMKMGLLQDRMFFNQPDFDLLKSSVSKLKEWTRKHPNSRVDLSYPEMGDENRTMAILQTLPNTCYVWRIK